MKSQLPPRDKASNVKSQKRSAAVGCFGCIFKYHAKIYFDLSKIIT